ncbi:putative membrane protein YagU involved in acid resistance [Devosia subaequoris]|uniref:Putative membrane protein YagU involved in acid resistance n=1 Tax=Devosia subaequoris TaxID=395930 RepID=A0A7W6NAC3_9HYPH|nr:DUF6789 family protein [Devosia subaequoris]MBB4051354.1 putative membrane protein YagU involved in acid resistance [Devosia subaequoris]MCP1208951.1 DUF1440 domain-containing protein [Devosia subaequoris]
MSKVLKGLIAGFVATLVLSALMVMKQAVGLMPELDVATMLTSMLSLPSVAFGWLMHFMIGTLAWGIGYALLRPYVPGGAIWSGVLFGTAAWLMMMIAVMPMAGTGLFGINMGIMAPIMTFMLHAIFGAVLGAVYQALAGSASRHSVAQTSISR